MNSKKDDFKEKVYPAQKTLQMKAGTGEISKEKVTHAEGAFDSQKALLKDEVKKLLKVIERQCLELDKIIDSEDFVSAPEKQQIVTGIVTTLMNIKSGIGYSDVEELNQLTSLVLETFDDAKVFTSKTKTAMRDYINLIRDFCDGDLTKENLDDIRRIMVTWTDVKNSGK